MRLRKNRKIDSRGPEVDYLESKLSDLRAIIEAWAKTGLRSPGNCGNRLKMADEISSTKKALMATGAYIEETECWWTSSELRRDVLDKNPGRPEIMEFFKTLEERK